MAEQAVLHKHVKYNRYAADVIPFALTTFNAWAKETRDFANNLCLSLAKGNHQLASRLLHRLRDRVAVKLAYWQARVIQDLNRRNRVGRASSRACPAVRLSTGRQQR